MEPDARIEDYKLSRGCYVTLTGTWGVDELVVEATCESCGSTVSLSDEELDKARAALRCLMFRTEE